MQSERNVRDINAFFAEAYSLQEKGSYIFRGQVGDMPLLPTIAREPYQGTDAGKRLEFDPKQERKTFELFCVRAAAHFPPRNVTALDKLVIAQHYGMPTRLLDWSESFLLAASMAVRSSGLPHGEKSDAIIHVLGKEDFTAASEANKNAPLDAPHDFLYTVPPFDARMAHQQAWVLCLKNPALEFKPKTGIKLVLDQRLCFAVKNWLYRAGIDYEYTYPGLEGIAKQAGWHYKWRW